MKQTHSAIYMIATSDHLTDGWRGIGFWHSKEEAEKAIKYFDIDVYRYRSKYAIIEEYYPGVMNATSDIDFYELKGHGEDQEYITIPTPNELDGINCIAIA